MGPSLHRFFVGTYTRGASRGIYAAALDARTGALSEPVLAAAAPNPTFLALSPGRDLLYAVCAGPSWASSFRVDAATGALSPLRQAPPGDGPAPCHIAVDRSGRVAVAANYHLGLAAALALGADGAVGPASAVAHAGRGPHPARQAAPHVHSANLSPDGRFALVCDLGLDRIYTYRIGGEPPALLPGRPPFVASAPSAGPRHLAFGPSGRHAYAINELDNTVVAYAYDAAQGGLSPLQAVSVLPAGYAGEATAAEVGVHPGGRFLYGSCRGPDTLSVFAIDPATGLLAPVETVPSGGRGPRHFALTPDGAWLVCAHQDSGSLCAFGVDPATGRLGRVPGTVPAPMPVCVLFLD